MSDEKLVSVSAERWIEWIEPFGDGNEAVIMRMLPADVAAVQRRREPRYETDEQAIEDFMVVHWARYVDYPRVEIVGVAAASADVPEEIWKYQNLVRAG
jgi:hypothetical protein